MPVTGVFDPDPDSCRVSGPSMQLLASADVIGSVITLACACCQDHKPSRENLSHTAYSKLLIQCGYLLQSILLFCPGLHCKSALRHVHYGSGLRFTSVC